MYRIEYSKRSWKFMQKLDRNIFDRIYKRIGNLKENPVPKDSKFLWRSDKGEKVFRYRVGDYRVLYKVKEIRRLLL